MSRELEAHVTSLRDHIRTQVILKTKSGGLTGTFLKFERDHRGRLSFANLRKGLIALGCSEERLDRDGGAHLKTLFKQSSRGGRLGFNEFAAKLIGVDNASSKTTSEGILPTNSSVERSRPLSPRAISAERRRQRVEEELLTVGPERLHKILVNRVCNKAKNKALGNAAIVNPQVLRSILSKCSSSSRRMC